MPPLASSWRGEQLSLVAKLIHARQSSEELYDLILIAKNEMLEANNLGELDPNELVERSRNIELLEQDIARQKSLDPALIVELAKAKADGYSLWQEAKKDSNFNHFAPALTKLIALRKEQSNQLDEPRSCWETLAQPFEPDLTKVYLENLFLPLRKNLPELLEKTFVIKGGFKDPWDLDELAQKNLCDLLLKNWGRNPAKTALGRSPHPFSITLGPQDFRLTTRVVPGQPLSCFLASAHEWGHSLYEQGLPSQTHQWFAWPLGQATSMALHESQSLFWENRVARSLAFSERFWTNFVEAGAPLKNSFDLWHALNPLKPGLNRVEADEVSYGFHILIRTDLEIALLEQGLEVEALPNEWNKRYSDLLGVTPMNDAEGCLQDVHWSEGQFGYFPSYLLGHLISAQFAEAMSRDLGDIEIAGNDPIATCISKGKESLLLDWLRKKVHPFGRQMNAEGLVRKVTGKSLSSTPFLNYLGDKLEKLNTFK